MKRGIKLEAVYFESPPHTSVEAKEKVKKLLSIISEYGLDIKLHVIPFTKIQEEILKNIPHDYLVTIMRRMMYRISERIARHNNDLAIINGESIGQVASQTLTSMNAINEVVSIPVIRPLACFDKLEIIDIAEKIGTYNTSILPYEDCCTIFVPTHPVINPDKNLCKEYEEKIPYEELIKDALKNQEIISNLKEETFKEYL
jgi:thiamine biosynthesis protein ThiI